MTTDKEGRAPLYVRALRLRNLHVGGFGSFVLFECMIAIGVLLALAELVTWWAVLVLPVAVAVMVKINDVAMSGSRARRAAGARERTGLDGVRAEQSRAAYRSLDDRSADDHSLDQGRTGQGWAAYHSLDDTERGHAAAHRSYDDADRGGEPIAVQRHTATIDRDDLDQAGESRHGAGHAAERARAAGRAERAGVGAGQRTDSEFAVAGQRTAVQSDEAGLHTSAVAAQTTTSRTIPAAGSVVGGQRSNSGAGTPQSEEPRRPVGVIRISIPPRDGGTRGTVARTTTTTTAATQPAAAEHPAETPVAARPTVEAEVPVGEPAPVARHTTELAAITPAQVATDPTTGHVYGEDTGVVPGTGIWLNRPGTRRADDSYTSQPGDGQGAVYGRGGSGAPSDDRGASVHSGQGAVYGRGGYGYGYDPSDGEHTYGGTPRNGGNYGTTYGTGSGSVYGSATSDARYATGDDSDADYGYATDNASGYGHGNGSRGGYGYQVDTTDPYGNDARYSVGDPQGAGNDYPTGAEGYPADGPTGPTGPADAGYAGGADGDAPSGQDGGEYRAGGYGAGNGTGGYADGGSGYGASGYGGGNGYGQGSQSSQGAGQGYGGGHGLDDSLWSGSSGQSRGQERRTWVGGPAGYDPASQGDSFNSGHARGAYGDDNQYGDEGRHSRGRHADEDHTSGRHTDRGWRVEDDLARSRTTTNQGRFA